ncbi:caspase-1-like isoform X2 [Octopus sinensis]|uniref:Caspase-1-like isoform X2 n=1 Tax=Octopus sinensis TaxID=2607531 RepID=A0A7E6FHI2_9MOLL|nr:caspase-1-like isoform X2 [Octopus sinensis]XP_036367183.1 caspase-1-like isoform X2 [Octopus sinensis]XP_036367184.1 caspase-1-like isoform X2 [Octopus sinensis]XP_036367185.1 caspase-1-like isoform X2 [Octopus sinensis]
MTTMDARYVSEPMRADQFHQSTGEDLMKCFNKYDMTHKRRGVAYIFNNENFKRSELATRYGSSKDTEDFKKALIKLGFREDDIKVYMDATVEEMRDALKQFGKNSHTDIDCFICAILSHGGPDDVICGYDDVVKLDELFSYLRPKCCPSLTGVPKLFFVEASRGSKIDVGVEKTDADLIGYGKRTPKIPVMADMLVVYSSSNEYSSFINEDGSWFMQALSKMLMEYGNEYEIMKLLTAVSNRVASLDFRSSANSEYNGCKQMPHIMSTLIKELKFEPKK